MKDLELWTQYRDWPRENCAIALDLNLTGKARLASSELPIQEMSTENGYQLLIEKLDLVFQQDNNRRFFNANSI